MLLAQAFLVTCLSLRKTQRAHPHQQTLFVLHGFQPCGVVVRQAPHGSAALSAVFAFAPVLSRRY